MPSHHMAAVAVNGLKRKDRFTLIEQSAVRFSITVNDCSIRVYQSFLQFIIFESKGFISWLKNSA